MVGQQEGGREELVNGEAAAPQRLNRIELQGNCTGRLSLPSGIDIIDIISKGRSV